MIYENKAVKTLYKGHVLGNTKMSGYDLEITQRKSKPYHWLVTFVTPTMSPTFEMQVEADEQFSDVIQQIINRIYLLRVNSEDGIANVRTWSHHTTATIHFNGRVLH